MSVEETMGWFAASLVFCGFYLRTMTALRLVAMAGNFAFITYALLVGSTPILALHCLLLPLNAWRLLGISQKAKSESPPNGGVHFESANSPYY